MPNNNPFDIRESSVDEIINATTSLHSDNTHSEKSDDTKDKIVNFDTQHDVENEHVYENILEIEK